MINFDEFLEDYKKRHSLSSGETIYTEKALKEIVAEYLKQCQFPKLQFPKLNNR